MNFFDTVKSAFGGDPKSSSGNVQAAAQRFFTDHWQQVRMAYTVYHQTVWEALLFYVGEMWVKWDPNRKLYQTQEAADEWVPRPRINRFAPAVDAVCANFAGVPEVEAVPADSLEHDDDLRRYGIAEVANDLIDWWRDQQGLDGDFRHTEGLTGNAALLFVLAGCLFTRVYAEEANTHDEPIMAPAGVPTAHCTQCGWYGKGDGAQPLCPQCGAPTEAGETYELKPSLGPDGQPVTHAVKEWRIRCEIGNPLWAIPRPSATGMGDTGWFMWARRHTLDEIRRRWNYEAQPDAQRADGASLQLEQSLNFYYQGFGVIGNELRDSALVVELFIEPKVGNRDFPQGVYAVYCNEKVVHAEPWNFVEHPFTKGGYQQNPTLFFDRSVAFDLVNVQRELKDYESLIKLHAMVNAATPWVADENTKVSEITGRADRVIWYRSLGSGTQPPQRAAALGLDPGVYQKVETLKEELEHISGAVAVFRGEQPGSVKAAAAISQLRGQAEQMFSKPVQNWNALWRETVRKAVAWMQQRMTLPQIAAIVGNDRLQQIEDFLRADLSTEIEFVATQNGLPRTRDEKRQELMMMWDKGALDLGDANVRQKVFELFGETGMMAMFNADASRARKENRDIKAGGQPNFMPEIEDLAVHYSIHAQQIKSLDFDSWAPAAQQVLLDHAMATKQAMQQQAAVRVPPVAGSVPTPGPSSTAPAAPPMPVPGAMQA